MLENIDVNILYPHPNNPRKDLGDLTELTESIKAQGILQNLTVVKIKDSYYTVIIGHRRLAAAKLAGLTEVPCSIADMDMKTQLSTMLLENMQRTDLTPYEQAKGFQTCLDFGVTIDELSAKTGLSKTTVKHRLKILELDPHEVEKVETTSIFDFIKLEELEDVKYRNIALQFIGKPNFYVEVARLKDQEKRDGIVTCLLATLNAFAKRITTVERKGWVYFQNIYLSGSTSTELAIPEDANCDADDFNYAYELENSWIAIYKKATSEEKKNEYQEKQNAINEARTLREEKMKNELKYINEVRNEFVKSKLSSMTILEYESLSTIIMFMLFQQALGTSYYSPVNYELLAYLTGIDFKDLAKDSDKDEDELIINQLKLLKGKDYHKFALATVISMYTKNEVRAVMSFTGEANVDEDLVDLYDLLEILGYQISDVEKSILDGSHELYVKGDKGND